MNSFPVSNRSIAVEINDEEQMEVPVSTVEKPVFSVNYPSDGDEDQFTEVTTVPNSREGSALTSPTDDGPQILTAEKIGTNSSSDPFSTFSCLNSRFRYVILLLAVLCLTSICSNMIAFNFTGEEIELPNFNVHKCLNLFALVIVMKR